MTVKPVIRGLIDRQGEPDKANIYAVKAYVVKVNWADLQPVSGGPITTNNAIDAALARVRNAAAPVHGLALKLRVFAGNGAPDWAKKLGGAPLPYASSPDQTAQTGTLGRWWTSKYINAYGAFQKKLAALYDTVPEIRELTYSMPCTFFDEPMVRNPIPANVKTLLAAGYTETADKASFISGLKTHTVWANTTTDIDFSPFPIILNDGYHGDPDMGWTIEAMDEARTILGARAGLQNNALSTDKLANHNFTMLYQAMQGRGAPIIFQTATKASIGDPDQSLQAGVDYGAGSIELPSGYPAWGLPMLGKYNALLGGINGPNA